MESPDRTISSSMFQGLDDGDEKPCTELQGLEGVDEKSCTQLQGLNGSGGQACTQLAKMGPTIPLNGWPAANIDCQIPVSSNRVVCLACSSELSKSYWNKHIKTLRHVKNYSILMNGSQLLTTSRTLPNMENAGSTTTAINKELLPYRSTAMLPPWTTFGKGGFNGAGSFEWTSPPPQPPPAHPMVFDIKRNFNEMAYTLEENVKLLRLLIALLPDSTHSEK